MMFSQTYSKNFYSIRSSLLKILSLLLITFLYFTLNLYAENDKKAIHFGRRVLPPISGSSACEKLMSKSDKPSIITKSKKKDSDIPVDSLFTSTTKFQQHLRDKALKIAYNIVILAHPEKNHAQLLKLPPNTTSGVATMVTTGNSIVNAKLAFITYMFLQYIVYPHTVESEKIGKILSTIQQVYSYSYDIKASTIEEKVIDETMNVLGIKDVSAIIPKLVEEYKKISGLSENDTMIPLLDDLRYLYSFTKTTVSENKDIDKINRILQNFYRWLDILTNSSKLYKYISTRSFYTLHPEFVQDKDDLEDYLFFNSQILLMNLINSLTPSEFISVLTTNTRKALPIVLNASSFSKMKNIDINSNWALTILSINSFITTIKNLISKPETPSDINLNSDINFNNILSYLDQHAEQIYIDYVKQFISTTDVKNLPTPKNINLISFIEAIYVWGFKIQAIQNLDKERLKQEINKIINLVFDRYIQLDEFQRFFFMWTLKNVAHTSTHFNLTYGLNILDTVISVLSGFLLNFPDKLSKQEIQTITNVGLSGIYAPAILKSLFSHIDINSDKFYFTLKLLLSNEQYTPYLSSVKDLIDRNDFNLNKCLEILDFKLASKFMHLLVKEIKTPKDLSKILSSDLHDSYIRVFLQEFDTENFIKTYPILDPKIDSDLISNYLLINISSSFPTNSKDYVKNFVDFTHYYLTQKTSYTLKEWNFITQNPSKFEYDLTKLNLLSLKEIIHLVARGKSWFSYNYKKIIPIILSKDILEYDSISDEDLILLLKDIISYLPTSTTSSLKPEFDTQKLDTILTRNPSVLEVIIKECSVPSYSQVLTKIKIYLIDHLFIPKEVKIKRQVAEKNKTTTKNPEYTYQVSSLLESIEELKYSSASFNIIDQLMDLFTKLIDFQNSYTGGKGQKLYIDIDNALTIIFNFFKNFDFNSYPQFKDYIYSKISKKIWDFLFSHKINIITFISNWLTVSNLDTSLFVEIIKELYDASSLKNDLLYSCIMNLFKKHFDSLTKKEVLSLVNILISILKADNTTVYINQSNQLKLFNVDNICRDIIPLIIKIKDSKLLEKLLECVKNKLQPITQSTGISDYDINILHLNRRLINSLLETDSNITFSVLISLLSPEALLYIKNTPDLYELFSSILSESVNEIKSSVLSSFVLETQKRLESIPLLEDRIDNLFHEIDYNMEDFSTDSSKVIREATSIAIILLNEIKSERLPLDFSSTNYVGVGYDVISVTPEDVRYIEVKSKMAIRSEKYPLLITYNEALKAIEYTQGGKNPDKYKLYAVPLKPSEIDEFGQFIDLTIDYSKLKQAVTILGEKRVQDFANNIENYEKIPIADIIIEEQKDLLGL